ncbi:MAG: hypothetical protein Q4C00_01840, partial [Bacillota bacterium]|nr:hypothetical protein [Bacillota bacterium]
MHFSIKTKMFAAMNLGVLLFAAIFMASHFLLFEDYVMDKNYDMLVDTYKSINKELITSGELKTTDLESFENRLGLHIVILDQNYNYKYSVTMTEEGEELPLPNENITPNTTYGDIIDEYKKNIEKQGYINIIREDNLNSTKFLYLIGSLVTGDYLVLRTPLPAIEANIEYSRFFII